MSYIKSVISQNFQSHKKTVLHFHHGVNVIIGESDRGKSAILRSIVWAVSNKSKDRGFRSRWGGKTDIEITFTDGPQISRVQDESKHNAYYLYDPVKNIDEEYKAFKTDIPEDIVEALNLDSINIQNQFDNPFLLAESSGDVAKMLNQIANLTDIDISISNIRKQVLANSKEISSTEEQIIELEIEYAKFAYLAEMETDIVTYEMVEAQHAKVIRDEQDLSKYIIAIQEDQKEINEIDTFLKAEQELEQALTLIEQEKAVTGQLKGLENFIIKIETATEKQKGFETILSAESEVNAALELIEKLDEVQKEGQTLTNMITRIQNDEVHIKTVEKELKQKQELYLKLMPNICPLCGGSK